MLKIRVSPSWALDVHRSSRGIDTIVEYFGVPKRSRSGKNSFAWNDSIRRNLAPQLQTSFAVKNHGVSPTKLIRYQGLIPCNLRRTGYWSLFGFHLNFISREFVRTIKEDFDIPIVLLTSKLGKVCAVIVDDNRGDLCVLLDGSCKVPTRINQS